MNGAMHLPAYGLDISVIQLIVFVPAAAGKHSQLHRVGLWEFSEERFHISSSRRRGQFVTAAATASSGPRTTISGLVNLDDPPHR